MKNILKTSGFAAAVAVGAAIFAPTSSTAAELVKASNPYHLMVLMQNEGFKATLETDDYGDPLIQSEIPGKTFQVFFYGCTEGHDCSSIQFTAGYDLDQGIGLLAIDKFNAENRYVNAYTDDEDDPYLEMDVEMADGIAEGTFIRNLQLWKSLMGDFNKHIDW